MPDRRGGAALDHVQVAMPPGGMCSHLIKLTSEAEADAEVIAWIRAAFDAAA